MKKNILITGSSGLIGSNLCMLLEAKSYTIIKLDIRDSDNSNSCGSILDKKILKNKIKQCDGIIHLAGVSRVVYGQNNPDLCELTNIEGTKNIVEIAKDCSNKPWIIYASSREVYGQQDILPVTEDRDLLPMNVYAHSKVKAEEIIINARQYGLNISILRFSNVFGGIVDYPDRVIPAFCINALNEKPLFVEGVENTFDFTYVKDVTRGIWLAVEYLFINKKSIAPLHFTNGKPITLNEAARIIKKIINSKSEIIEKPPRTFDVARFFGDNSRAKEILEWQPEYSFSEAIKLYVDDLKNSYKKLDVI